MNSNLLPIGTLVYHDGHGNGTIVAYNSIQQNTYVEANLGSPEVAAAVSAGLGEAIVSSFYSGSRYPYVVQFEPSDRFPTGYKDVYDVDGTVMKAI
jgi:hypothetical protein